MSQTGGVVPSALAEESSDKSQVEGLEKNAAPEELSQDDVFEILSNHRRRFALHYLHQNGELAELGNIAEHVAAWENDIDVGEISSDERKRVYTSLQQFHLPKLDEKNIVDYDDREGVVSLNSMAEDVDVYLEIVEGRDVPWSQFYLALAAVNLAIVVAAFVGTYPLTAIPMAGWAVFVVVSFLLSAIAHAYFNWAEMRLGNTEKPPELET